MTPIKNTIKLACFLYTTLVILSCNRKIEYKYADKLPVIDCEAVSPELITEALYAFEDYILKHYTQKDSTSIGEAYSFYWSTPERNLMPKLEQVSDQQIAVLKELRRLKDFWIKVDNKPTLNPNHPFMQCIKDNITGSRRKLILESLLATNSFKSELFLLHIGSQGRPLIGDKALAAYFALNHFYAPVLEVDFDEIDRVEN